MAEAQYRFTVAYLLLSYVGITAYFGFQAQWWRSRILLYLACLVGPAATYVFWAEMVSLGGMTIPHGFRLLAILPACGAILLLFWCRRTLRAHERLQDDQLCVTGPFRWTRNPLTGADSVFFLSLSVIASNQLVVLLAVVGLLLLQRQLARDEQQLRERFGPTFETWAAQTGRNFFKLGDLKSRRYSVPRRFGLSAVMALLTTFGLLFGFLNYAEAPPVVYIFASFEIVAICLSQIVFGSAPRGSSAASGALILPICVWLTTTRPGWMSMEIYWTCMAFLFLFGSLLGYCLGALAAGFFLVMDLIEPYLPGGIDGDQTVEG